MGLITTLDVILSGLYRMLGLFVLKLADSSPLVKFVLSGKLIDVNYLGGCRLRVEVILD